MSLILDPGHGGQQYAGKSSPFGHAGGGLPEKELTLQLAHSVASQVPGARLTRSEDRNLSLAARRALVAPGSRAFVSLHASPGGGNDVWVHPKADSASRGLAQSIASAIGGRVRSDAPMAILHPDGLPNGVPACLVEAEYDSLNNGGVARIGGAIARGLGSGSTARAMTSYQPGSYGVPGLLVPVQQPNTWLCWAAANAMMRNWRHQQSRTLRDNALDVAQEWADRVDRNEGIAWADYERFAAQSRMTLMPAQNLTAEGWVHKFHEVAGPIWVAVIPGAITNPGHVIVLEGIEYDGTSGAGTRMFYIDPADGQRHSKDFPTFVREYEQRFIRDPGGNAHVLHW